MRMVGALVGPFVGTLRAAIGFFVLTGGVYRPGTAGAGTYVTGRIGALPLDAVGVLIGKFTEEGIITADLIGACEGNLVGALVGFGVGGKEIGRAHV